MLVATAQLAQALEQVATDYLVTRFTAPGNPLGTQLLRSNGVVATKVPFSPHNSGMNRVNGLSAPEQLAEVLSFYAASSQQCWINVVPGTATSLTTALVRAGFRPDNYSACLYAAPLPEMAAPSAAAAPDPEPRIEITHASAADLDTFLDTMNAGFDTPLELLANLRRNQHFWPTVPTWRLLLARIDGAPAGAAVLSIHERVGYLAAAATLPEFRRRGVQARLIDARIALAREHGCTMINGQAAWGSGSQANQQRAGLVISHVKTIWTNSA